MGDEKGGVLRGERAAVEEGGGDTRGLREIS